MIDRTNDEQVLAATVYGEARGEPLAGKHAVACVVMNRVAATKARLRRQFGTGTAASACLAPWQFSSWNDNDPNRAEMEALDFANPYPVLADCIDTARAALAGRLVDITGGATFYKVTSLPWPHDWGAVVEPVAVVGHHSFYRLP